MGESLTFGAVFLAGLLSFFSPCILPILPVYVGMLSGDGKEVWKGIPVVKLIKTFLFLAGISTSFLMLGLAMGAIGKYLQQDYLYWILGGIVILLGFHQMGLLQFRFLERKKKVQVQHRPKNQYFSSYLLGLLFSFGWTPCIGPIMASVSLLAALKHEYFYAAVLIMVYALGMMIPFFVVTIFSDVLLNRLQFFKRNMGIIKIIGGVIIVLMGILLMTNNLGILMFGQ